MSWDALPLELEEQILSKLALVELARLSSTRKVFLALFRKHLAQEQKVLCDKADISIGLERIKRAAVHLSRFLKKDIVKRDEEFSGVRMFSVGQADTFTLHVKLYDRIGCPWVMRIHRAEKGLITLEPTMGQMSPGWVSVMHALLSGVPLPFLDGQIVRMCLPWQPPLTSVEVKAQVAPLLPLVACCKCEGLAPGGLLTIKERMLANQAVSDTDKGVTLAVDCSKCVGYRPITGLTPLVDGLESLIKRDCGARCCLGGLI
jgi:hypothetical protein